MGANLVHKWPFKKGIGTLASLLNFGGLLDFLKKVYFVWDPTFSRGHKIGLIGAGDLIFLSFKCAKWIGGWTPVFVGPFVFFCI